MAHPESVIKAKGKGQYDNHFEWKFIHSCHSLEVKKGPISFKIVFTHPVQNGPESPPREYNIIFEKM